MSPLFCFAQTDEREKFIFVYFLENIVWDGFFKLGKQQCLNVMPRWQKRLQKLVVKL